MGIDKAGKPPRIERQNKDWHIGVRLLMLYWEKQREYARLEQKYNLKRKT